MKKKKVSKSDISALSKRYWANYSADPKFKKEFGFSGLWLLNAKRWPVTEKTTAKFLEFQPKVDNWIERRKRTEALQKRREADI